MLSPASGSARRSDADDVAELVDAPELVGVASSPAPMARPSTVASPSGITATGAVASTSAIHSTPDAPITTPATPVDASEPEPATTGTTAERPVPAVAAAHDLVVPLTDDGVPLSLDVFAVTSRAVLVLIGTAGPAEQIAKTAIGLSIESERSAAFDIVVPRAIDLVLYRAKALVNAGIAPDVVESYEQRLDLWRRLSLRSGLEPATIVLSLAPFPNRMIASMLRVALDDVDAVIERWSAGIDPAPTDADEFAMRPAQIATGAPKTSPTPADAPSPYGTSETVGATAYAAASAAASAAMSTASPDPLDAQRDQQSAVVAMNEDALNAFLGLPEGKGSRLRQAWRRFSR